MNGSKVVLALGMALLISGCQTAHFAKKGEEATPLPTAKGRTFVSAPDEVAKESSAKLSETKFLKQYQSLTWKESVNLPVEDEYYPTTAKITPKTLRRTLDEYYVPMVSEELHTAVDYYEFLDTLDYTFLGKYSIKLYATPDNKTLNLTVKHKF